MNITLDRMVRKNVEATVGSGAKTDEGFVWDLIFEVEFEKDSSLSVEDVALRLTKAKTFSLHVVGGHRAELDVTVRTNNSNWKNSLEEFKRLMLGAIQVGPSLKAPTMENCDG